LNLTYTEVRYMGCYWWNMRAWLGLKLVNSRTLLHVELLPPKGRRRNDRKLAFISKQSERVLPKTLVSSCFLISVQVLLSFSITSKAKHFFLNLSYDELSHSLNWWTPEHENFIACRVVTIQGQKAKGQKVGSTT
jgi:hypothetical protein